MSITKTAIVIMSDPNAGGEEQLGRVFNALAVAYDLDQAGDEVHVQFQGTGTRWPEKLDATDHPAHGLFEAVRHTVVGASKACALLFGAGEGVQSAGLELIADNGVPGTAGLAGIRHWIASGHSVLVF